MIFTKLHVFLDLTRYSKKKSSLILKCFAGNCWKIDGKVESAAVKCAAWNQAMNKMLAVLLCDFLALFSSGDVNVEWMEDDAAVIPALSATREADGSAEEQPESTKSAIAFDIALNWWNVGVLL